MSEIVYNLGDSAVFCAFHDLHVPIPIQLPQRNSASMYAQLTRCFSAVAELLVHVCAYVPLRNYSLTPALLYADK